VELAGQRERADEVSRQSVVGARLGELARSLKRPPGAGAARYPPVAGFEGLPRQVHLWTEAGFRPRFHPLMYSWARWDRYQIRYQVLGSTLVARGEFRARGRHRRREAASRARAGLKAVSSPKLLGAGWELEIGPVVRPVFSTAIPHPKVRAHAERALRAG
jgi:hypothetical protein